MPRRSVILFFFLFPGITCLNGCATGVVHHVTVNPDGSFYPTWMYINSGDTVEWQFSEPSDTIIPVTWVGPGPALCTAYQHYDAANINEFTGPLPRAASGIFSLSPDGPGTVIETQGDPDACCPEDAAHVFAADKFLCPTGEDYATMDWTWQQPDITGVFIRLRWNEIHLGPGLFVWSIFDEQIEKAVQNGKLYSLSFKAGAFGTPDWIFDPTLTGAGNEAIRLNVRDDDCGRLMVVGSPADANYRTWYFQLLSEAAQRIKDRNAWYRALAYIKPSGANKYSHENRLANSCDCGCDVCNPQTWAVDGNYTPSELYNFCSLQTALLADALPGKDMSYMLIQAGFPKVNDLGEYETCPSAATAQPLPGGTEQTEDIIAQGYTDHQLRFVVQHNGLGPKPQDRDPPEEACRNEGDHPKVPPFRGDSDGCPNRWVLAAGAAGQVTGFQTNNPESGVSSAEELESTLLNAWDNSDAVFVEAYETLLWQITTNGGPLDPAKTNRTLGQWADEFHRRRRDDWIPQGLDDPFPTIHRKTFFRTSNDYGDQLFHYVNGTTCGSGETVNYGVIAIRP